ncbi:MAG: hypothetical protein N2450_00360 [bacterium]|nr:hypothetical protein [bacterium]
MNIIHFRLRQQSGFATPLRGDTLIGNLLWQYLYNEGLVKFEALLNYFDDVKNVPACSDLFPIYQKKREQKEGYCIPIPIFPIERETADTKLRKKIKKIQWIDIENWISKRNAVTQRQIYEWKTQMLQEEVPYFFEEAELHNTINRYTGTTGEGGSLYTRNVRGYGKPYDYTKDEEGTLIELHGYLYCGYWGKDEAKNLLSQVGEMGYGADATTGLGRFQVTLDENFDPKELFELKDANAWMALSRHLPDTNGATDVNKGFYTLETHYGRLGGALATSGNPYKKPLLLFGTGSVWPLKPRQDGEQTGSVTYGMIVKEMGYGDEGKKIRHLGYTLALPLKVTDEEILQEWASNNKEGN